MKRVLSVLVCLSLLLCLCACGREAQPERAAPPTTAESPIPARIEPEIQAERESYNATFTTANGQIEVSISDDNADSIPASMPVLRVRPRAISIAMAKQMASALFGEAQLYEDSEELSKTEIAEMIALWEEAVTDEAILRDHGEDSPQSWIDSVREGRLAILEYYRNAYANAREEVTATPCQWKFWPQEHYAVHGFDYAGTDPSYTDEIPSGISVDLRASVTDEGIPYVFWINNNDSADFRNHSLSVFVQEPDYLFHGDVSDEVRQERRREWNSALGIYSPSPATADELEAARLRAESLAEAMGLGQWQFSAGALDKTQDPGGGWLIQLEGLPIYEGFPVSRQNQLGNVRSTAPQAQNCYYEALEMLVSNDGTLINLYYCTPMELVEVVEQAAPLMSREQLEPLALSIMQGWDYGDLLPYDIERAWWRDLGGEITEARAAIDSVRVGYTRVKYDAADFLLIPSITFRGKAELLGVIPEWQESAIDFLMADNDGRDSLLTLDLRDGSEVMTHNPAR